MLGVHGFRQRRLPVEKPCAVKRREEPLVGVHYERIGVLRPLEKRPHRLGFRQQGGSSVGRIDVEPKPPPPAHLRHPGQVVNDPGVGCPGRGHHRDHVRRVGISLQRGLEALAGQTVPGTLHDEDAGPDHVQRFAHRRMGILAHAYPHIAPAQARPPFIPGHH